MKTKALLYSVLLSFVFSTAAYAQEIIVLMDSSANTVSDEEMNFDGIMVTPGTAQVVDETEIFPVDARNKYIIYSVDVFNTRVSEINVSESLQVGLSFAMNGNEYLFDSAAITIPGEEPSILGEWTVYETNVNTKVMQSFTFVVRSIDENGKVDMTWGSYDGKNPRWDETTQCFVLDDTQTFRYEHGVLGGGGGPYRSVIIRETVYPDPENFVLMPLEQGTYQYIVKVPNYVAEKVTDCEVKISSGEESTLIPLETEGE